MLQSRGKILKGTRLLNRAFSSISGATNIIDKRRPLELFLLGDNLRQVEQGSDAEADRQNVIPDEISQAHAQLIMKPTVDEQWLPNPLLYRSLELSAEYLDGLYSLQDRIKYKFDTKALLLQSVVDKSYTPRLQELHPKKKHKMFLLTNDRLAYIGNSLLNFTYTSFLYQVMPRLWPDSALYRERHMRNHVLLSSIAQEYKINDHVIYDKERIADLEHIVNAQAVRALVGAVYLDSGMDQTVSWLTNNFLPEIDKKVEKICEENAERKKAVSSSN